LVLSLNLRLFLRFFGLGLAVKSSRSSLESWKIFGHVSLIHTHNTIYKNLEKELKNIKHLKNEGGETNLYE